MTSSLRARTGFWIGFGERLLGDVSNLGRLQTKKDAVGFPRQLITRPSLLQLRFCSGQNQGLKTERRSAELQLPL